MPLIAQPAQILRDVFGFDRFQGEQARIIDRVLQARPGHCVVIMPTGGGKSLCYQIPALCLPGQTIVVSPLIALMQDQVDALQVKGVAATFINSSLRAEQRDARLRDFVAGNFRLLYCTPERFRKPDFVAALQTITIDLLAIDEAHCVSAWGHDFRPDYARLGEFRALIGNPTTIALTATATPEVQTDIVLRLGLDPADVQQFHHGIERPNLELLRSDVYGDEQKLAHIIAARIRSNGPMIVYFSLIHTLERFSDLLRRQNIAHSCYHGKLSAQQRKSVQRTFLRGDQDCILATNAFGMGIDKANIRTVLHAEIPGSLESYYQEIGRAGRDGAPSWCELLYDEDDLTIQMDFIKWSNPDAEFYQRVYWLLCHHTDAVRSMGLDYLREQLHFKHTRDFRADTALNMLDRYGVTTGSVDEHNITVVAALPPALQDDAALADKLLRDQHKLLAMVQYANSRDNPRQCIAHYFGLTT